MKKPRIKSNKSKTSSDLTEQHSIAQEKNQETITPQKLTASFNRPVLIGGRFQQATAAPAVGLVSSPVIS